MKLGYELKLKDSFAPNGTPPKVIDIMKTKDDPSVFYNGCYIDEFKLQSPVYQQLHILDWYDPSKTPHEERLVDDLVDENITYFRIPIWNPMDLLDCLTHKLIGTLPIVFHKKY